MTFCRAHGALNCLTCPPPGRKEPKQADKADNGERMNKSEMRYMANLQGLKLAANVKDYWFNSIKLKIGPRCWYKPDFAVLIYGDDKLQIHEVKGPHRFREKGIVKLRSAARQYPQFRFFLAKINKGTWDVQEIK